MTEINAKWKRGAQGTTLLLQVANAVHTIHLPPKLRPATIILLLIASLCRFDRPAGFALLAALAKAIDRSDALRFVQGEEPRQAAH